MKKFFNILFALSALGLMVACGPAGSTSKRVKRHAQEDVDPVDPKWDDTPEEILAQDGYCWMDPKPYEGTTIIVGFKYDKSNDELYAYTLPVWRPNYKDESLFSFKYAAKNWSTIKQDFDKNAIDVEGHKHWLKVNWKNNEKTQFTLDGVDETDEFYELDTEIKALQKHAWTLHSQGHGRQYVTTLEKWYTDDVKVANTAVVQALTKADWRAESIEEEYEKHFAHFWHVVQLRYDKNEKELYFKRYSYGKRLHSALGDDNPAIKSNSVWDGMDLLWQDRKNPLVFHGRCNYDMGFFVTLTVAEDLQSIKVSHYSLRTKEGYGSGTPPFPAGERVYRRD